MLARFISVAAVAGLIASPCLAADLQGFEQMGARQSSATAAVYYRLPLDRVASRPLSPSLGLRVTAIHDYRDAHAPTAPRYQADALNLRFSGASRPTLFIAGQPVQRRALTRLNLGSTETIALVGGGVLLLVVVAASLAGSGFGDTCPTVGGSRDHCINP